MTRTYDTGFTTPIPTLIRADLIAKLSPTLRTNGAFAMGVVEFPFVIKSYVNAEYELGLLIDLIDGRSPTYAVCVGDVDGKRTGAAGNNEGTYEVEVYCASNHARNLVRGRLATDAPGNLDNTFDPGIEAMRELAKMFITDQECPSLGQMGKGRKLYYKGEHHMITYHEWSVWAVTFEITVMLNTNMLRGATELLRSIVTSHHIAGDNMPASATPLIATSTVILPPDPPSTPFTMELVGDSIITGQVDTDKLDPGLGGTAPFTEVDLDRKWAIGASEPLTWLTQTGAVRPYAAAGQSGAGVELSLARELRIAGANVRLGLTAISGATLTGEFAKQSSFLVATTGKNLYHTWIDDVKAREAANGRPCLAIGVNLGGNDSFDATMSANFAETMRQWVADVRADLGRPVFIVWMLTNPFISTPHAALVRAAQIEVIKSDPFMASVETSGIPIRNDGLHLDDNGNWTLGQDMAWKASDGLGFPRQSVAIVPAVIGWGPGRALFGPGTLSVHSYGGLQPGDTEILVVTQGLADQTITVPAGFLQVIGAEQRAVIGGPSFERLNVFQRAVIAPNPPPTSIVTLNALSSAKLFAVRGPLPFPKVALGVGAHRDSFDTGPFALPTNNAPNSALLVDVYGGYSAHVPNATTPSNGVLTGYRLLQDSAFLAGNDYQVIAVAAGDRLTSGPTGESDVTAQLPMMFVGDRLVITPA